MALGLLVSGAVCGLVAAAAVAGAGYSFWLAVLAYAVVGSLGTLLVAAVVALREAPRSAAVEACGPKPLSARRPREAALEG